MSEQVRLATRELRWEQIQAALTDLLQEGDTAITLAEIARRCDIPRAALSKEAAWKTAIASAEAERVRRRAEQLQQLRVGFITPTVPAPEAIDGEAPPVSLDTVVRDIQRLVHQAREGADEAYQRGRMEALAEHPTPETVESGLHEAYERGREAGRNELTEDLNQAYERGLRDGRETSNELAEAYERGRQDGFKAGGEEARNAYDRGRSMGRAELQVEVNQAYERGVKEGKAESAADVMNAYDRGRRDGWEEGRREGANGGRSMFGFNVNKANPDREWALAILHAPGTATPDHLRTTYRMLTKAFHPDRNPDVSPEFIRNLNRAKEILGF
ncbi:hypothetical protein J7643_09855 [bacterium]|nr:hypothetical protein [bacterium]